jgi:glycosyltransferase involved in cell wall biosynthesis
MAVMGQREAMDLSVIVPVHNEQDSVPDLYSELCSVLRDTGLVYELIFIDDGSWDGTRAHLQGLVDRDPKVTVVSFTRCYGQTAALAAGFKLARGRVLVAMDGDLQNDPHDIPALLAKLDEGEGYDVVSGWRRNRQDRFWTRRLPSMLANRLIARITWTHIHDFGCTLKAYRREALEGVELYGEMHRFLPALVKWRGGRITEMAVNHRPRKHGRSKYGLRRTVKVMLDLITVKFLGDYLTKPIYFFGKVALISTFASLLCLGVAVLQKYGVLTDEARINLNRNIFFLFSLILFLATIMFIMMGVISELLVRIYHESQGRPPYKVRQVLRGRVITGQNAGAEAEPDSAGQLTNR